MTLPGTIVTERDAAVPRTTPTDTGVAFIATMTEKGPVGVATPITSMQAYARVFGARVSYSVGYDAIEGHFRNGGTKVYVSRIVGPAAATATVTVQDGTSADAIRFDAAAAGDYGNALNVDLDAGTGSAVIVTVTNDDGDVLAKSGELADTAAIVAYCATTGVVTAADLAGGMPAPTATPVSLTGGTDDRAAIEDDHRIAALVPFRSDLGPGQVGIPGATTEAVHAALANHCLAMGGRRKAFADLPDTDDVATLKAAVAAIRALGEASKHIAFFAPAAIMPGVAPRTTRTVPLAALAMGQAARIDARGNPNVAAAGDMGVISGAVGLSQTFTDEEREELNDAGVNVAIDVDGQLQVYGYRTAADPALYPLHWQLANVRLDMAVAAKGLSIGRRHTFRQIDGQGIEASAFAGELTAMLADYYRAGALYGPTADDAFRVDVGPSVNTPESVAEGRLRAVLSIRRSPMAERVEVEVVKTATNQAV